jgi:hypothetical protein
MGRPMKKVVIIIPYFGKWPDWFDLYIHSCKWNPSIDWLFYTDCSIPQALPPNIRFKLVSFKKYCQKISETLGIRFNPSSPYKLCDVKPALGLIHKDEIIRYDYFAFGDIDLIYGDLRKFYTTDVLSHLLVSSHRIRVSGHLCFIQNNNTGLNLFKEIPGWVELLEKEEYLGLDEYHLSKLFIPHSRWPKPLHSLLKIFKRYGRQGFFKEQYSTILISISWIDGTIHHPEAWQWKDGHITNSNDGDREFAYFHFMNWKNSKYLNWSSRRFKNKYKGQKAAWENKSQVNYVPYDEMDNGWILTRDGIFPLRSSKNS